MTGYAIAHLRPAELHDEVIEYMERIQSTLDPFGGRFLVHGAPAEVKEGAWEGGLVLVGFPSIEQARAWYESPEYQKIIPLRADHMEGDVVLVEGVGADHDSGAFGRSLRES